MAKAHHILIEHRQRGEERTAILTCSCGLKYETNLRNESLRTAGTRLADLHKETPKPKKKSKKQKPLELTNDTSEALETESTITPSHESLTIETETNEHGDDDFATPPSTNEPEK